MEIHHEDKGKYPACYLRLPEDLLREPHNRLLTRQVFIFCDPVRALAVRFLRASRRRLISFVPPVKLPPEVLQNQLSIA